MRRPNFKGNDRSKPLKTNMPVAHIIAPDVDNLVKFVLDRMNKIVCG